MSDSISETMRRCEALLRKHSRYEDAPILERIGLTAERVRELVADGAAGAPKKFFRPGKKTPLTGR